MSAVRTLSVTTARPPLSSICIMSEVPERGSPDTMTISFSTREPSAFRAIVPLRH